MNKLLLITFLSCLANFANAYIPDYHLIMSHTADNHGHGVYVIDQDVIFRGEPDPLVVHETWWVAGENTMRVAFEGRGLLKGLVRGTMIYEGQTRIWREGESGTKTLQMTHDWAEPFFYFRLSKNIKNRLISMRIAPSESARERSPRPISPGSLDFKYPEQGYLRLSRTGGNVAYAIGNPSPKEGALGEPGLWIEQDQFVVRKIRLPSQALVQADQYFRSSENFWLPKVRTYSWNTQSAQIIVNQVKSTGKKGPTPDWFKSASLATGKNSPPPVLWPEQEAIREFYQRFR
jgi:hypothetical protein